jgi:hypothetical protein
MGKGLQFLACTNTTATPPKCPVGFLSISGLNRHNSDTTKMSCWILYLQFLACTNTTAKPPKLPAGFLTHKCTTQGHQNLCYDLENSDKSNPKAQNKVFEKL